MRQAGVYIRRFLRGEKPRISRSYKPTKFELAKNLGTAKALGIDLPPTLLEWSRVA